jgi:hypothetical protein
MATLISNKISTYDGPYAYYTMTLSVVSRTATKVKLKATAKGRLRYSNSYLGTGSGYGLTAGVYIGGEWHTWTLKSESTRWEGTSWKDTKSTTFEIDAAANKSYFSDVRVRVLRTGSGTSSQLNSYSIKDGFNIPKGTGDEKVRIFKDGTIRASAFTVSTNHRITSGNAIQWPAFKKGYTTVSFRADEIRAKDFIVD